MAKTRTVYDVCVHQVGGGVSSCTVFTLREARAFAKGFGTLGTTANVYKVAKTGQRGVRVRRFERDTSGDGTRWFSAEIR